MNAFIGLFTWAALLSLEPLQFEDVIFIGNNCFQQMQRVSIEWRRRFGTNRENPSADSPMCYRFIVTLGIINIHTKGITVSSYKYNRLIGVSPFFFQTDTNLTNVKLRSILKLPSCCSNYSNSWKESIVNSKKIVQSDETARRKFESLKFWKTYRSGDTRFQGGNQRLFSRRDRVSSSRVFPLRVILRNAARLKPALK